MLAQQCILTPTCLSRNGKLSFLSFLWNVIWVKCSCEYIFKIGVLLVFLKYNSHAAFSSKFDLNFRLNSCVWRLRKKKKHILKSIKLVWISLTNSLINLFSLRLLLSIWPGCLPLQGLPAVYFKQVSGSPLGQLNDYPQVLIHPWHCCPAMSPGERGGDLEDQSSGALMGAFEVVLNAQSVFYSSVHTHHLWTFCLPWA